MLTDDSSAPLILVVEDDVGHYELIQSCFKKVVEKYRIANVSSLHDARAALGRLSPGLVLVDHELPDGNGRDFVAMANGLWPIILMIDQGNEQMAVEAMKAGAQDYIVKSEGMFFALPGIVKIALREWDLIQERKKYYEVVSKGKRDWERTFDAVPDLISIIDSNHCIIRVNKSMADRCGLTPAELVGRKCCEFVHGVENPPGNCPVAFMLQDGLVHNKVIEEKRLNGVFNIMVSPLMDDEGRIESYVHIMRDITEQKKTEELVHQRLKLRDIAYSSNVMELMQATVDACEKLTDSSIGFFHLVDEDQQHLILQAWSSNTLAGMCTTEGRDRHYPISQAGVWVECFHTREPVIHNDYVNLPNRKGLPAGHAPVLRELTVPVIVNDKVISIIGVGNKALPYTEHDVHIVKQFVVFSSEVIGRKKAIIALENSEEKYRKLATEQRIILNASSVGICFLKDRRVLWANPAFDAILGYEAGATLNMATKETYADNETYEFIGKTGYYAIETGEIYSQDVKMKKKDGSTIWCNVAGQAVTKGTPEDGSIWIVQDITERKTVEEERYLMMQVYNLLNKTGDLGESIKDIISMLKNWTGYEAVGIRLQDGEDFPYFEALGFPAEFIAMENLLCTRDPSGAILRDSSGNPVLECMCGNVLQGNFDPSLPFFTTSGSFWTNSTTRLLANTTEADRQSRTRNRCNGEGYESVALIPMNCTGQFFGLLQFNDHRPNCFTPELIALFERVADVLTIALSNKKALDAVQESATRFSQVSDQACELIWEVDNSGLYTYVSKGCLAVTGYAPEEIVGKMHFYDLHPDEGREAFKAAVFAVFERQGCFINLLNPVLTKEGEIRWVSTNGLPIIGGDQKMLGYRGTDADVTKQKNLEERLLKQALVYQDLLETSQNMIWRCDTEGCFTYVNSAWVESIGYEVGEILGKKLTDFQTAERAERDLNELLKRVAADNIKGYETELLSKTQEVIHVLINSKPLYDDNYVVIGVSGTAYDITERKNAEMKRQALEAQFQQTQKLESLGVLAGGIAHDFNNILAIIIGHCYIVNEDIESEIAPKTHVKQIEKAAIRASDLCRQMLTYAGKNTLIQSGINLWLILDESVKMLQSALKKNVGIELNLKYDVPEITGDSAQIQQVVMNLIINAAEAIGSNNGTVKIALKKVTVPAAPAYSDFLGNAIAAGNYACLTVTDNGCGMDLETQKRLFEPFYTTKFAGRGLGMSAVIGIIKSHEGALQLSSAPGVGTSFNVYFPLPAAPNTAETGHTADVFSSGKGSGSILLVDDEESLLTIGAALLKAMGFSVITAVNGREALEIYREHRNSIDLVLMDLLMPEMNGTDAYRLLREISPSVPIVICSGYNTDDISEDIANNQYSAVIQKPYNPIQLSNVLMKLLDKTEQNSNETAD